MTCRTRPSSKRRKSRILGFYSSELEGFTGVGHSVEDCFYQAKWGMKEHVALLVERQMPVPPINSDPKVIIQNVERLAVA